jgi:hypothetical protein
MDVVYETYNRNDTNFKKMKFIQFSYIIFTAVTVS